MIKLSKLNLRGLKMNAWVLGLGSIVLYGLFYGGLTVAPAAAGGLPGVYTNNNPPSKFNGKFRPEKMLIDMGKIDERIVYARASENMTKDDDIPVEYEGVVKKVDQTFKNNILSLSLYKDGRIGMKVTPRKSVKPLFEKVFEAGTSIDQINGSIGVDEPAPLETELALAEEK